MVVSTIASVSAQTSAPAQPAPSQRVAPPTNDAAEGLPEGQLLVMLDSYAMFQAQQQLSISDEKFGPFAGRLKKLQDARRRNQRERHRMVVELRKLLNTRSATAADDALLAQLARLKEHDRRAAAELQQAYDALDEILDPRQQARYRLFEEQIEQRKLELLMRAREKARQSRQR